MQFTDGACFDGAPYSSTTELCEFSVTSSGTNVSITPSGDQVVTNGSTKAFTVTAKAGYTPSNTVGGTCPTGSWSGDTYTTGAITENGSVSFSASINSYTVGGTLSGYAAGTLVLQNNSGDNLTLSANGTLSFATSVNSNAAYSVTVLTQPTGYTCSVSNASGTMGTSNVTNVSVTCTINSDNLTYHTNSATGGSAPSSQTANHGSSVTLVGNTGSLVRTHYFFVGWNTAADGSGTRYLNSDSLTLTSNTTLYAEWAQPKTFYVATTGSDTVATGFGTAKRSLATIGRAVSLIGSGTNATGQFVIRAASGVYPTTSNIYWDGDNSHFYGKSLAIYGSYNSTFTTRDPRNDPTFLVDTRNSDYPTTLRIIAATGANRPTTGFVVDGIHFQAGQSEPGQTVNDTTLHIQPNDTDFDVNSCTFDVNHGQAGTNYGILVGDPTGSNTKTTTIRNNRFRMENSGSDGDIIFGVGTGSYSTNSSQTFEI